jgi:protein required for attachment to host cells
MPRRSIVWLCLADGEHAKILTPAENGNGYTIVAQFDSADAHRPTRALGTDRPPRTQESAYSGRHAIVPRNDLHAASKAQFMRLLAEHLDRAGEHGEYDAMVVVAPTYCLRLLRGRLKPATLRRLRATKAKDLIKTPLAELPADLGTMSASPQEVSHVR